jgi:hypothetical protein
MEMCLVHVIAYTGMFAGRKKQVLGNDKIEWEFVRLACFGDARLWVIRLGDWHCKLQEGVSCINASARSYGRHILDMCKGEALQSYFHFIKSSSMRCSYGNLARQAVGCGIRYRSVVVLVEPNIYFWMAMVCDLPCQGRNRVGRHERCFIHHDGGFFRSRNGLNDDFLYIAFWC